MSTLRFFKPEITLGVFRCFSTLHHVLHALKSFPQESDLLSKKLDLTGIKWPEKIFQQFGQDNINNPAHRRILCIKAHVNLMNVDCKETDKPPTLFTKQCEQSKWMNSNWLCLQNREPSGGKTLQVLQKVAILYLAQQKCYQHLLSLELKLLRHVRNLFYHPLLSYLSKLHYHKVPLKYMEESICQYIYMV